MAWRNSRGDDCYAGMDGQVIYTDDECWVIKWRGGTAGETTAMLVWTDK